MSKNEVLEFSINAKPQWLGLGCVEYLEEGDNGTQILLVLIDRHVLEGRASIGKTGIVCTEEHRHRQRRTAAILRRKRLVDYPQSPPRVVTAEPSQHHISLKQMHTHNYTYP